MADNGIDVQRNGAAAVVTLSNPGRKNAFHPDMRRTLTRSLIDLNAATEVRAIVIAGEGNDFCAGADVSRIPSEDPNRTPLDVRENIQEVHALFHALAGGSKPTIACVEGACAGAGLSIALGCDVIVGARNAVFACAFTRLGLLPDMGMLHLLPNRVGLSVARRFMMGSVRLTGEDAHGLGLVDELTEPGAAMPAAQRWADDFAAGAPAAIAAVKAALADGAPDRGAALRAELAWLPVLTATHDHREAVAAFKEKRPPTFTGR